MTEAQGAEVIQLLMAVLYAVEMGTVVVGFFALVYFFRKMFTRG